jgi:hypothetical protein
MTDDTEATENNTATEVTDLVDANNAGSNNNGFVAGAMTKQVPKMDEETRQVRHWH